MSKEMFEYTRLLENKNEQNKELAIKLEIIE